MPCDIFSLRTERRYFRNAAKLIRKTCRASQGLSNMGAGETLASVEMRAIIFSRSNPEFAKVIERYSRGLVASLYASLKLILGKIQSYNCNMWF